MILFKKFRFNFITKKRIGEYLMYAIGEIILITIGVLLAVNINNWNTEKQAKKVKEELLLELADELQYNIDRIYYLDTVGSGVLPIKAADSLFKINVSALKDGLDNKEILRLVKGPTYRYNSFNLSSFAFEQIKEAGILNKLDKELKIAIKQYYKYIEREDTYNNNSYPRMLKAIDDCKYGYIELRQDYNKDSTSFLKNHEWILNESSKNFIDMKQYIKTVSGYINDSRSRMLNIIAETEELKLLLEKANKP